MAKKEFKYRGRDLEELKKLSVNELAELFPAKQRRKIKKGFTEEEKKLREAIKNKNDVKTHVRTMLVLPEMVGKTIRVHNGKEFQPLSIQEDMVGHFLGEFVLTRKRTEHSAPGVGATKSSSNLSVR